MVVGGMGKGVVGPAWTRGEIEKPQGIKSMGTWEAAVYTEEQQTRLGVDEMGKKLPAAPAAPPSTQAMVAAGLTPPNGTPTKSSGASVSSSRRSTSPSADPAVEERKRALKASLRAPLPPASPPSPPSNALKKTASARGPLGAAPASPVNPALTKAATVSSLRR